MLHTSLQLSIFPYLEKALRSTSKISPLFIGHSTEMFSHLQWCRYSVLQQTAYSPGRLSPACWDGLELVIINIRTVCNL